jgi:hypothetical protein
MGTALRVSKEQRANTNRRSEYKRNGVKDLIGTAFRAQWELP